MTAGSDMEILASMFTQHRDKFGLTGKVQWLYKTGLVSDPEPKGKLF